MLLCDQLCKVKSFDSVIFPVFFFLFFFLHWICIIYPSKGSKGGPVKWYISIPFHMTDILFVSGSTLNQWQLWYWCCLGRVATCWSSCCNLLKPIQDRIKLLNENMSGLAPVTLHSNVIFISIAPHVMKACNYIWTMVRHQMILQRKAQLVCILCVCVWWRRVFVLFWGQ